MILSLDFETFSCADIGSVGSYKYIADPDFEILLLSYAFDDGPVVTVDFASGDTWPRDFLDALYDPAVTKTAWNCAFEREVLHRVLGREQPPEQWQDSMILAAVCGLPLNLAGAGDALGLGEDQAKLRDGKALIRYFCVPCKPTKTNGQRTRNRPDDDPDKWDRFVEYNAQDVVAERTIRKRLSQFVPDDVEHRFWCLDARINERGVLIDRVLAEQAVALDKRYVDELTDRAVKITGLDNPKSVSQVKSWLEEQEGVSVPSLNKKVVADVVASLSKEKSKEFMRLRSDLSKSSTAKYKAMLRSASDADDHVRGCFQFYGASRTGRFAGRLLQLQNLPQNHLPDLDSARRLVRSGDYDALCCLYDGVSKPLSELIRTAILPEPGQQLLVSDFSAIEARVISWIADEKWRLDAFRAGEDIYCATASQMFHVPVVKHGENGELRQKGKIAELACGYGGGVGALKAFGADKMGMTEEEMQDVIDRWRGGSPRIVELWRTLERAAIRAVVTRGSVRCCHDRVTFAYADGALWMTLPSGRKIAYWGAQYGPSQRNSEKKTLSYRGVHQQTRKWTWIETWGGKLTENLVQATARDCLRDAMLALDTEGYDIRAHVHDEVICTEPLGGRTWQEMSAVMSRELPWAVGLPLRADGYSCPYYQKD